MAVDRRGVRRQIALAATVGLVVRLAFGLLYWVDKPLTHDEQEYLALADSLARGRGLTYPQPPLGTTAQFGRAPGYPAFLAALGAGSTTATAAPARVKIAQALIGSATVLLIACAAMQAAGPAAAAVAAWLAALYPPLVWIPSYVFSESLYSLLAIASALTLQSSMSRRAVRARREGRGYAFIAVEHPVARAFAAGILCGVAVLVRPAMLALLPLAVAWLAWRRALKHITAFVIGSLLVIAPWTVRNLRTYDRFVLVAAEGGVTFWTGNHPLATGEGDLATNPQLKRAEIELRSSHPGLTAEQLEPLYYRDAISHITADPIRWLRLLARKLFYTIVPAGPSYALHSIRYRTASVASYLLLLPFAAAGAVRIWRSPYRPTALFLLAAASGLVCIVFFPQERFRIPVIDPFLIVCAAALADSRK